MPKEETFPIPLKYIDITRSTYTDLDVMQEKRGEAQVFVHDLNLFVTVQIHDDTPAVLPLGKLCEEHGYACEWAGGQKTTVDHRAEDS